MKKALLVVMCFMLVSVAMVNGTFALPSLNDVFQAVAGLIGNVLPEEGGTVLDVDLVSDNTNQVLLPGGEASRTFHVKNNGSAEAYFRLVCAVQYDEEIWKHLTISFTHGEVFTDHGWKDISIGGVAYKMRTFTYEKALAAGYESPNVSVSIAMDEKITSKEMDRLRSDFMKAQALAIETESFNKAGFDSAEKALDAALPLDKLNPF